MERTYTVTESQLTKLFEQARTLDKIGDAMEILGFDATKVDDAEGHIRDVIVDVIGGRDNDALMDFAGHLFHAGHPPSVALKLIGDYAIVSRSPTIGQGWSAVWQVSMDRMERERRS
ncbi:hypothetical protein ACFSR7_36325 [Cohnella sp. GCM10020058]|uniref:hypothetical protein n=1 Tax=Cohnella sp. GCM10020058 TaxID=3317330 RepID=UPI0036421761